MSTPETCGRCGLDCAAHTVETSQGRFCTWHCARQAADVELARIAEEKAPDGAEVAVASARERIVERVRRGARA